MAEFAEQAEAVAAEQTISIDKSQFSDEEISRFREVFSAVDADNSGSVSTSELQNLFKQLGYDLTVEFIAGLVSQVDVDGSQDLSFDEFVTLLVLVLEALKSAEEEEAAKAEENAVFVADPSQFSAEELAGFREAFDFADTDKSGTVSYSELQQMFSKLGFDVASEVIVELVRQVDVDGSENLSFEEFITLVVLVKNALSENEKAGGLSEEEIQSLREVFDLVDTDKSGTISTSELGEMLRKLDYDPTEEQLAQLLATVDDDNSGSLNFDEFVQLVYLLAQAK